MCVLLLHFRHVNLFAFFSFEHCMGKPDYERVELYSWGVAIGLGRSGRTTICRPLSGLETPGTHKHAAKVQTPIGCDTISLCRPHTGYGGGAPANRE